MDLSVYCFSYAERLISHRVDLLCDWNSGLYKSISVSVYDFSLPRCKSYLLFNDCLSRLDEIDLSSLWAAESIDMGLYQYILDSVFGFAQLLNVFDEIYWRNIDKGLGTEFIQKTEDLRIRMLWAIIDTDDSELPGFLKKAWSSNFSYGFYSHFLFGHSVKIDHHMRPVIDAWIKFVLWTDARCQANGGKFVITLADKEDWLLFSNSFQVPAKA